MKLVPLKLLDMNHISGLDEKVSKLLAEFNFKPVKHNQHGTCITGLYELPGRGAIEYQHSTCGNDIPSIFIYIDIEDGELVRTVHDSTAGELFLLGFDETSDYFLKLLGTIYEKLKDYVLNVDNLT